MVSGFRSDNLDPRRDRVHISSEPKREFANGVEPTLLPVRYATWAVVLLVATGAGRGRRHRRAPRARSTCRRCRPRRQRRWCRSRSRNPSPSPYRSTYHRCRHYRQQPRPRRDPKIGPAGALADDPPALAPAAIPPPPAAQPPGAASAAVPLPARVPAPAARRKVDDSIEADVNEDVALEVPAKRSKLLRASATSSAR